MRDDWLCACTGHCNMYIVAMYFKYLLLPQCQPNDLVILDGASYWKCRASAACTRRVAAVPAPKLS